MMTMMYSDESRNAVTLIKVYFDKFMLMRIVTKITTMMEMVGWIPAKTPVVMTRWIQRQYQTISMETGFVMNWIPTIQMVQITSQMTTILQDLDWYWQHWPCFVQR